MVAAPTPTSAAEARVEAATAEATAREMTNAETGAAIESAIVDAAVTRAENAERTAEAIADAALRTELGQRIDGYHSEHSKWQQTHEQMHSGLLTTLEECRMRLASVEAKITEMAEASTRPIAVVASSLTPDGSTETAVVVNPDGVESAGPTQDSPAVPGNRKRMRMI